MSNVSNGSHYAELLEDGLHLTMHLSNK